MPSSPAAPREVVLGRDGLSLRGRITVYRDDALPQNAVHAAFQDSRGYLWFGTQEGVVRYDGSEWKAFRMADGLVYNFVQAIAEDRSGMLWFGTRIGLCRFDPFHRENAGWRSYGVRDGLPDINIRAIGLDSSGALWIATRNGLSRRDAGSERFVSWDARDAAACTDLSSLAIGAGGRVWIGSNVAGVACWNPRSGQWTEYPDAPRAVRCLALDGERLWIGTAGSGISQLDPAGGAVVAIGRDDGLADSTVLSMLLDSHGDLWLGTEQTGVACLRNCGARHPLVNFSVDEGLADFTILSLLEDRSGLLWIGALGGLTCFQREGTYRGKTWHTFTRRDGLAHDLVAAILEASDGRFWFGTFGRGASSLDLSSDRPLWRTYDTADGLSHNVVRAIAEDARGRIWFGTFGRGLSCFDPSGESWRTITASDGLAGDQIRCIRSDERGHFWVATDGGGLSVFDPLESPPRFTNFGITNGLTSNRVSTIVHHGGKSYVGTYEGGLCIHDWGDRSWTTLTKGDGLAANDVYGVAVDPAGRLWIGSGGSGLTRIENGTVRIYTERDGLPNDVVYQILVESERSIYCSTNRGVFRLRIDGETETILSFDRSDGLGDDEANGGASCRDRQGRLWFGTIGGASRIDPKGVPDHVPPCRVYITDFIVHDEPFDLSGTAVIEDSRYEFVFHYGAVEYVSPQKVRYRSRLAGLESEWSKVSTQRQIRYTNLRPGRYTFRVQARNWGGEWSEAAELTFEVVPDALRLAREEAIERERIEKKVLEAAHVRLQELAGELRIANEKLREKEMLLEMQAREDALTGLLNRRYLDLHLRQEYERAVRFHRPLTVAIADLDHFKEINDVWGHAGGDEVLRAAARLLRANVRSVDTVARYGGEEFVILLPETSGDAAAHVCEKIRRAVAEHRWNGVGAGASPTISIGHCDEVGSGSAEEMLRIADRRLFAAKRAGRNRVCGSD